MMFPWVSDTHAQHNSRAIVPVNQEKMKIGIKSKKDTGKIDYMYLAIGINPDSYTV